MPEQQNYKQRIEKIIKDKKPVLKKDINEEVIQAISANDVATLEKLAKKYNIRALA